MEMTMSKHTDDDNGAQYIEMYGCCVCLQQVQGFEIVVSFAGGTWPDGADKRTFPNMAEALVAIADIAQDLERDEGDDWYGDAAVDPRSHDLADVCPGESVTPRDLYAVNAPLGPRTGY